MSIRKTKKNLIANGEFESDVSGWQKVNGVNHPWDSQGHPGNSGSVKLVGHPNGTSVILQRIEVSGTKGDTYDIGGWAKANASSGQPFEIWVTFFGQSSSGDVQKINFNPYCTDWQYAMKNVEADSDYTQIQIAINYSGQINEAYFDGIVVYKGEKTEETAENSSGETTTPQETTEPEPTTSIGSDGSVTTIEENDGIKTISVIDKYENDLSNETIVDGISYKESKKYISSGNYLKSSEDSWGTKTSYDYDENTGNLNSVNVHYNPINYTYDKAGNITKVSQNVNKLSNGTAIENSYLYDSGDSISRITHNGFDYNLGYTEFGLLESIKIRNQNLINYSYNNDGFLTSESYGNGQTIDYEYNEYKNKTAIKQNDKTLYAYSYDEFGNLISIKDNISDRVTNYTTDTDGKSVTEETSDGVYHKLYSSEKENVEIIGDETKSIKTASDDHYNKLYWTVKDNVYSTYLNNIDKYDRTSSESIYRIFYDSDDKEVASSKKVLYNKEYSYMSPGSNKTSDRVSKLTFTGGYNKTLRYGYDAYGNISEINNIWYLYDEASQLTTEVDITTGTGKDYIYDKGGNITEVRHFTNGEYGETDTFTYGDDNWKDLLTEYNGNEITYDEIGNPLTYYNGTEFKWTMGRRLKSAVRSDGVKIKYTYNADGLRTSKTINNVKFNYYWNGDKLTAQINGDNNKWYFRYDDDTPIGFEYNGKEYYYVTNLQGDIIAVLNDSGECVAEYTYDAWGNCTVTKDTEYIAHLNPLRYRGYYFDSDTGLYYLQSRYYDSNTGRFINSDTPLILAVDPETLFQYNTFIYCNNNPIAYVDNSGDSAVAVSAAAVAGGPILAISVSCVVVAAGIYAYCTYEPVGATAYAAKPQNTATRYKATSNENKNTKTTKKTKKATVKKTTNKKTNVNKVNKVLEKISNKIKTKDGKRVDLSKFNKRLKKGEKGGPGKWKISPDDSNNGGSKWKLFKGDKRIASLDKNGRVLRG